VAKLTMPLHTLILSACQLLLAGV